ncbi:MAG: LysM peptidoglycan-binding domain-containing protein [Candidatus Omnitrophica bacterium]|jgi:nucleoid-associated protein YgaU|nr:LysM peptidoglycan-binding domain-containing protein [Candidatus Omnitrophota bacterium]
MKKEKLFLSFVIAAAFLASGCVVRTYKNTRDRVDQNLSMGNRGYLKGNAPAPTAGRATTRDTRVVEVELHPLFRLETKPKIQENAPEPVINIPEPEDVTYGNRGYVNTNIAPVITEPVVKEEQFRTYKVEKGDTLQKISEKLYGTTKNWYKIYKANQDVLKSPDKIRPGQTIKIPDLPAEKVKKEPAMKKIK